VVIAFPPEGIDSGRERAYLRIGLGEASWIGSFEIGHMSVGTVSMMPDDKHLFVSAKGAGYIIDLKTRTLVEQIGTDVAGVTVDAPRTLFLVDHNGMSLELFGKSGRLWETDAITSEDSERYRSKTTSSPAKRGRHRRRGGSAFRWTSRQVRCVSGRGFTVILKMY
jgi:hypothetical protein